jgi:polyisoprenoid-binding protein YceI
MKWRGKATEKLTFVAPDSHRNNLTFEENETVSTFAIFRPLALAAASGALCSAAMAAPTTYELDPNHTHPSFEADHMGGLSKWRGTLSASSGSVTLDQEAQTGSVDVTIDMSTIDFGHQGLNDHAKTPDIFDVAKYPTATYTGKLVDWKDGAPTAVEGDLTMHGVTKPVKLEVNSFLCKLNMQKREVCGADAIAQIQRDDFGVDFGKSFGFDMGVTLRIQVEGLKQE